MKACLYGFLYNFKSQVRQAADPLGKWGAHVAQKDSGGLQSKLI